MKILIVFLFLAKILFASVVDFGVQGKEYPIEEEDYRITMQKKLDAIPPKKINALLKKNITNSMISNNNIGECKQSKVYSLKDYVIAPFDAYDNTGKLLYKQGDKIFVPKNINAPDFSMCIVDGKDEDAMIDDINYLHSLHHDCNFILNNYSVEKFTREFPSVKKVYILNKAVIERFKVNCYPTIIEERKNIITHREISKEEINNAGSTNE